MGLLDKRNGLCAWPTFTNSTRHKKWTPPVFNCIHIVAPHDGLLCPRHLREVSGGARSDGQRVRRERDGGHHLRKGRPCAS